MYLVVVCRRDDSLKTREKAHLIICYVQALSLSYEILAAVGSAVHITTELMEEASGTLLERACARLYGLPPVPVAPLAGAASVMLAAGRVWQHSVLDEAVANTLHVPEAIGTLDALLFGNARMATPGPDADAAAKADEPVATAAAVAAAAVVAASPAAAAAAAAAVAAPTGAGSFRKASFREGGAAPRGSSMRSGSYRGGFPAAEYTSTTFSHARVVEYTLPREFRGAAYGALFEHSVRRGRLVLGLLRPAGTQGAPLPWVATNPPAGTALVRGDLVIALESADAIGGAARHGAGGGGGSGGVAAAPSVLRAGTTGGGGGGAAAAHFDGVSAV